jgi:hypothetical protein
MKVSTENNNFGYEKITIVVDNIPLRNALKNSYIKQMNNKQFIPIYNGPTIFDIFEPRVTFVHFSSIKKPISFVGDHPMNIPTKFGSNQSCGFREDKNVKAYG